MPIEHRILIITMGGTIAGEVAQDRRETDRTATGNDFLAVLDSTFNHLGGRNKIDIHPSTEELCCLDSSDIQPEQWSALANLIRDRYDDFDSFVVTHGTNTLGYTCAALSFALGNPNKPIVLTGSQVPSGVPGSDGLTNLQNAIRVAVWQRENGPLKGVMAVFGSHIITGTRVKKDTEFDYDAFKSFNSGSIGRIGRIINIDEANLAKHLSYINNQARWAPARKGSDLRCDADFDMRIASLTEFPGMSPDIFQTLAEKNDIQGFILRAFGAGDPACTLRPALEYLKRKEIPIVVTTQAPNGNSNFQVNDPGKYLRDHDLAIPAYDMSIESQTTKLAWLLAKKRRKEINYQGVCEQMIQDLRGEIKVLWEIGA